MNQNKKLVKTKQGIETNKEQLINKEKNTSFNLYDEKLIPQAVAKAEKKPEFEHVSADEIDLTKFIQESKYDEDDDIQERIKFDFIENNYFGNKDVVVDEKTKAELEKIHKEYKEESKKEEKKDYERKEDAPLTRKEIFETAPIEEKPLPLEDILIDEPIDMVFRQDYEKYNEKRKALSGNYSPEEGRQKGKIDRIAKKLYPKGNSYLSDEEKIKAIWREVKKQTEFPYEMRRDAFVDWLTLEQTSLRNVEKDNTKLNTILETVTKVINDIRENEDVEDPDIIASQESFYNEIETQFKEILGDGGVDDLMSVINKEKSNAIVLDDTTEQNVVGQMIKNVWNILSEKNEINVPIEYKLGWYKRYLDEVFREKFERYDYENTYDIQVELALIPVEEEIDKKVEAREKARIEQEERQRKEREYKEKQSTRIAKEEEVMKAAGSENILKNLNYNAEDISTWMEGNIRQNGIEHDIEFGQIADSFKAINSAQDADSVEHFKELLNLSINQYIKAYDNKKAKGNIKTRVEVCHSLLYTMDVFVNSAKWYAQVSHNIVKPLEQSETLVEVNGYNDNQYNIFMIGRGSAFENQKKANKEDIEKTIIDMRVEDIERFLSDPNYFKENADTYHKIRIFANEYMINRKNLEDKRLNSDENTLDNLKLDVLESKCEMINSIESYLYIVNDMGFLKKSNSPLPKDMTLALYKLSEGYNNQTIAAKLNENELDKINAKNKERNEKIAEEERIRKEENANKERGRIKAEEDALLKKEQERIHRENKSVVDDYNARYKNEKNFNMYRALNNDPTQMLKWLKAHEDVEGANGEFKEVVRTFENLYNASPKAQGFNSLKDELTRALAEYLRTHSSWRGSRKGKLRVQFCRGLAEQNSIDNLVTALNTRYEAKAFIEKENESSEKQNNRENINEVINKNEINNDSSDEAIKNLYKKYYKKELISNYEARRRAQIAVYYGKNGEVVSDWSIGGNRNVKDIDRRLNCSIELLNLPKSLEFYENYESWVKETWDELHEETNAYEPDNKFNRRIIETEMQYNYFVRQREEDIQNEIKKYVSPITERSSSKASIQEAKDKEAEILAKKRHQDGSIKTIKKDRGKLLTDNLLNKLRTINDIELEKMLENPKDIEKNYDLICYLNSTYSWFTQAKDDTSHIDHDFIVDLMESHKDSFIFSQEAIIAKYKMIEAARKYMEDMISISDSSKDFDYQKIAEAKREFKATLDANKGAVSVYKN